MKTSSLLSITFVGAALILGSTGCKHGTQGITDIPHPGYPTPPVRPVENNNTPPPGTMVNAQPPTTAEGLTEGPHGPWGPVIAGGVEDRATLKDDAVYYDFDSATIKKSEDQKLEAVASFLKSNQSDALRIEGNCDERGTEKYNLALGEKRAEAAREYLVNLGIDSRQIVTETFGAAKPVDPGHNETAWKKNRRGDMVILTPK